MPAEIPPTALIACHECDLLQREVALPVRGEATCSRCGAHLYRDTPNGIDLALVFTISSVVLLFLANAFPLIGLELQGARNTATLIGAVGYLYGEGLAAVAGLVLITTILVPAIEVMAMLYILLPLRLGYVAAGLPAVFRIVQFVQPWGMVEVFMLGVVVSLVRVANFATVEPGIALWSFGGLMLSLSATAYYFNQRDLWACVKAHT